MRDGAHPCKVGVAQDGGATGSLHLQVQVVDESAGGGWDWWRICGRVCWCDEGSGSERAQVVGEWVTRKQTKRERMIKSAIQTRRIVRPAQGHCQRATLGGAEVERVRRGGVLQVDVLIGKDQRAREGAGG